MFVRGYVLKADVIELNKMLCRNCQEKIYANCIRCEVYKRINALVH
jgi:hypothetical protein